MRPKDPVDHSKALPLPGHMTPASTPDTVRRLATIQALDSPVGLPMTWCGDMTTTDNSANASMPERPAIKLVYAYPQDKPNDFLRQADAMQGSASMLSRYLAAATDSKKTLRFDMGTKCGPEYVDIEVFQLPYPQSFYVSATSGPNFESIAADVVETVRFDGRAGFRTVAIWADHMVENPSKAWGTASIGGPKPPVTWVPANRQSRDFLGNRASAAAMFMGFGNVQTITPTADPYLLLHEVTHTMGAVPDSSPHSTYYGHCWQDFDVMCYDDGGIPKGKAMTTDCPSTSPRPTLFDMSFDCGHDDYFRPMPGTAPGMGVNVYDNLMLQPCVGQEVACGGSANPLPDRDGDTLPDTYDPCPTKAAANSPTARGCPYRNRGVVTLPVTGVRAPSATMRGELKGTLATYALSARSLPAGTWKLVACVREERGRQSTTFPSGAGCAVRQFTLKRTGSAGLSGSVRLSNAASGVRYTAAITDARGRVLSKSPLDLGVGGVDALY